MPTKSFLFSSSLVGCLRNQTGGLPWAWKAGLPLGDGRTAVGNWLLGTLDTANHEDEQ